MKTVYILMTGERYEGGHIKGIYATYELAKIALNTEYNDLEDMGLSSKPEWRSASSFTRGCDWYEIQSYLVQED